MKILSLDLGTKTGWAFWDGTFRHSGTQVLAKASEISEQVKAGLDRCCDMRPSRLRDFLDAGFGPQKEHPEVIYFEDVQFLSTQYQAQLWASLRAVVSMRYPQVRVVAVPVGTLKKFATGHGNAKKPDMWEALEEAEPRLTDLVAEGRKIDDNEVDAIWLLKFALKKEGVVI